MMWGYFFFGFLCGLLVGIYRWSIRYYGRELYYAMKETHTAWRMIDHRIDLNLILGSMIFVAIIMMLILCVDPSYAICFVLEGEAIGLTQWYKKALKKIPVYS